MWKTVTKKRKTTAGTKKRSRGKEHFFHKPYPVLKD